MESLSVRLRFLSYPNVMGIVLPLQMCQDLQIRPRQKVTISLGKRTAIATVYQDKRANNSNIVKITSQLKEQLGIPHTGLIHLKKEGEILRIGPSIGIITTGGRGTPQQPFGGRSSFFHQLLTAQKDKGVYYFIFSPGDVDWEKNLVNAWFLRKNKKGVHVWKKQWTSLPDVIYDRIPSRSAERQESVQEFKLRLANDANLPMFNRGFFDKWGVHKLLYPMTEVNEHIPETHLAPTLNRVRQMLLTYPMIYFKPKNGSLGYGIVKVVHHPQKGYTVSYHNGTSNVKRHFTTLSSLYQHVFRTRRISAYLVQQGISLCTYQGRPFDFRVHLHKNQENEWVVSCTAAKVAGAGSVTTHVRTGGMVIPGEDLLQHLFGRHKEVMEERIKSASIRLAKSIEEAKGTPLGELGLDMGIDLHGHVWMFEANSKPGRSIFKHARLKQADIHSRTLLVDYSRYLANF